MSPFVRRRIVAVAVVVLLVVGGAALAARRGGAGEAPRPTGPVVDLTSASRPPAPSQVPADPLRPRLARPRSVEGTGSFITVSDGVVHRTRPPRATGRVALTFDDGPGAQTEAILRELERVDARATFFVLGRAARERPDAVLALRDAGMVIANHTWSHPQLATLPPARQAAEIGDTQAELARILGVRPRFFRPPYFSWSLETARQVASRGLIGVLFDVSTLDYDRPGVRRIVARALRARDGDVVVLHDGGGDRTQTLRAIAPIVRGLRAKGLEPVTLDELWPASQG